MALTEAAVQEKVRRLLLHHDDGGYSVSILWHQYDGDTTPTTIYNQTSRLLGGRRFKPPVGLIGRAIEVPTDEHVGPVGDRQQASVRFLFSRTEFVLKGLIPDPLQNTTILSENDVLEVPDLGGKKFRILRVDPTGRVAQYEHLIKVLGKDERL